MENEIVVSAPEYGENGTLCGPKKERKNVILFHIDTLAETDGLDGWNAKMSRRESGLFVKIGRHRCVEIYLSTRHRNRIITSERNGKEGKKEERERERERERESVCV